MLDRLRTGTVESTIRAAPGAVTDADLAATALVLNRVSRALSGRRGRMGSPGERSREGRSGTARPYALRRRRRASKKNIDAKEMITGPLGR
jgi:hypothetical protein